MDLGLKGRRALVCGASKGLGFACAHALMHEEADVILVARKEADLVAAAQRLERGLGRRPEIVAADVTKEQGRQLILDRATDCAVLVNNSAGPPTGNTREFCRQSWLDALEGNMLSAIALTNALLPAMISAKFGRVVNISSVSIKHPQPLLSLSTGARLGLTGYMAGLAREVAADGVTVNSILPGYFLTDRLASTLQAWADRQATPLDAVMTERTQSVPARRFGSPSEFGELCAYLCSAQAGYLTGQHIVLDGGLYPGTF